MKLSLSGAVHCACHVEQIRDKVPIWISHVASHRNASDVGKFGAVPNWGRGITCQNYCQNIMGRRVDGKFTE